MSDYSRVRNGSLSSETTSSIFCSSGASSILFKVRHRRFNQIHHNNRSNNNSSSHGNIISILHVSRRTATAPSRTGACCSTMSRQLLMCSSADVAKLPCEECRWQWESVVVLVSRMAFRIKNTNQNTDYNGNHGISRLHASMAIADRLSVEPRQNDVCEKTQDFKLRLAP